MGLAALVSNINVAQQKESVADAGTDGVSSGRQPKIDPWPREGDPFYGTGRIVGNKYT